MNNEAKIETFRIDSPFDKNDFVRMNLIKWEILSKKNRKQLIRYSIASIIIIFLWIITKTEEDPVNLFFFLGIGCLFSTLLLAYFRIFSKQKYTRKIKELAEKYDSVKMDCTYEFSDKSIKYWDKEKSLEFNWSVFANYSIYKNYLLIFIENALTESYIFEKKETDIDEYNKILEIVKSKLEYKEIK